MPRGRKKTITLSDWLRAENAAKRTDKQAAILALFHVVEDLLGDQLDADGIDALGYEPPMVDAISVDPDGGLYVTFTTGYSFEPPLEQLMAGRESGPSILALFATCRREPAAATRVPIRPVDGAASEIRETAGVVR